MRSFTSLFLGTALSFPVDTFVNAKGYAGFFVMLSTLASVETQVNQTITDCCAISGTVQAKEANTINLADSQVKGIAIPCLISLVNKKPIIDEILLATKLVTQRIGTLDGRTEVLNACLVSKTPATHLDAFNGYIAQIDGQYEVTKAAHPA